MNQQNAKDFLPLIQALADGKTIQIKPLESEWEDIYRIDVYYPTIYYRIKPEPRTFKIVRSKLTGDIYSAETYDGSSPNIWEYITVQEVLQ